LSYCFLLLFFYNSYLSFRVNPYLRLFVFATVFVGTFLLPSIIAYLLLTKGLIKSMEMDSKEERRLPFIITAFCYMATYYVLMRLSIPRIFSSLVLGSALMVVLAIIINFRWKISIHLIGIGGLVGAMAGLSHHLAVNLEMPVIIAICLAGCLATSRIILKSHIPAQVYAGFLLGLICEWGLFSL
jgi:hypothetical protein